MARTVYFDKAGEPEVMVIRDVELPEPGADEVRFRVKSLGLNRAESAYRQDRYFMHPTFPSRLGYEASGIVEAVGSNVKDFKAGDVVSVAPPLDQGKFGVYGEVAIVPAVFVIKHPSNLSFEQAAASWMQYLTAYGALIDIANMQKGDFVMIPAASSSVGLASIELCHLVGATPIALTRKNNKKQALLDLGATHVVVTEEEDIVARVQEITRQKGARIVFDPVGGKTVMSLAECMCYGGILFQFGALSQEKTPFPTLSALKSGLTMRGYTLFEILSQPARFEKAKKFLLQALEEGKLKPKISKVFSSLDEIVDAHHYMESNEQIGKIIVNV